MPWELKLILNNQPGQRIEIAHSPFEIGRHTLCHLQLQDQSVSRRHCTLTIEGDELRITDEGSQNGTLVNCQAFENVTELRPSDTIRIGPYLFLVLQTPSVKSDLVTDQVEKHIIRSSVPSLVTNMEKTVVRKSSECLTVSG